MNSHKQQACAQICGGAEMPNLQGWAIFQQKCGYVLVQVQVEGLPLDNPSGFYGLHIHGGDSCCGEGFPKTGSHYDPNTVPHPRHAGDLPPLLLCNGGAWMCVRTDRLRVEDIIGKTLVIHGGPDDFRTQPAGNAGMKIACGKIR